MTSYDNYVCMEGIIRSIQYNKQINSAHFNLHRYGETFRCFASNTVAEDIASMFNQGDEVRAIGVLIQVVDKERDGFDTEIAVLNIEKL